MSIRSSITANPSRAEEALVESRHNSSVPRASHCSAFFAIRDAGGTPMCNRAGEPFAFRFGLSRNFTVLASTDAIGDARPLPGSRFDELAGEAVGLLYQLPAETAAALWRNWKAGFARERHSIQYLWFDAIYELSWQRPPGDALYSRRYAWRDNVSIELEGTGLFPRLPTTRVFPSQHNIPEECGYPVTWYSRLADVVRASVVAVDELLSAGCPREDGSHDRSENLLLDELKRLPAAWFEEIVFRCDDGGAVPGKPEAQAVRAIELLKVMRLRPQGLTTLRAELDRQKGAPP